MRPIVQLGTFVKRPQRGLEILMLTVGGATAGLFGMIQLPRAITEAAQLFDDALDGLTMPGNLCRVQFYQQSLDTLTTQRIFQTQQGVALKALDVHFQEVNS